MDEKEIKETNRKEFNKNEKRKNTKLRDGNIAIKKWKKIIIVY